MKFKEDDLQMSVASYLDALGVLWFHVANERKTTKQAGARLKKKGVKSGVPDVMILEARSGFNGLAIELKIKPNNPTTNQLEFMKRLSKRNWCVVVCYEFDEVEKTVERYLNN